MEAAKEVAERLKQLVPRIAEVLEDEQGSVAITALLIVVATIAEARGINALVADHMRNFANEVERGAVFDGKLAP